MCARKEPFTDRQIAVIKSNPYTAKVTDKGAVSFTAEFKEFAYQQWMKGVPPRKIFEAAGYEKGLFSSKTMCKAMQRIRAEGSNGEGFKDITKSNQFQAMQLEKMKYEKAIKEMQEEIVRLNQEVEFLKKTYLLSKQEK